jgi:4-hydroxybenzoyl-CoA reductase subunit beta
MNLLPEFRTLRPETLADAVALLAKDGARPVAGGTDLLPNLRRGLGEPATLVDLSALPGFSGITDNPDGSLAIGAGTSLEDIAENKAVLAHFPALALAALGVAGPTHRAAASLGGNLCQDTRCIFYNQSEWWRESNNFCLKLKGDKCHVVVKSDRCYATYHGDVAPALMVLGALALVAGPDGTRTIPVGDLFAEKGSKHLTLAQGELLAAIHIPAPGDWRSAYEKARVRDAVDFPLAGIAVAVRKVGATVADIRVAVTGTNSAPLMVPVDGIVGQEWNAETRAKLADSVRKTSLVLKTTVMGPKYRRRVAQGLTLRLVDGLMAAA